MAKGVDLIKIVTNLPEDQAEAVRRAIAESGGGIIGAYSDCSFTIMGTGRFRPAPGANPAIGQVGEITAVPEAHIEVVCRRDKARKVVEAIRVAHPYEEVPIDAWPLIDIDSL